MQKKHYYLLALFSILLVNACKKPDEGFVKAMVVDSGDITLNGCGYLLRFEDATEEKPIQLLTAYQHNGMKVKVKYHFSEKLDTCGSAPPYNYYQLIVIDDIKRDLD